MQWSPDAGGGFSTGKPWLPLSLELARCNVQLQRGDNNSMLGFYRRLIELRRNSPALSLGTYTPIAGQGDLLSYLRAAEGQTFLVLLNLGHAPRLVDLAGRSGKVIVATDAAREGEQLTARAALLGDDGLIVLLDEPS